MNRYKALSTLSSVLGIAIIAAFAKLFTDWLHSKGIPVWLIFALDICLIVVGSQILRVIIDRLIDRAHWIRALWLGEQFVEGIWLQYVRVADQLVGLGIIVVRADGGSIRFSGEDYDVQGKSISTFMSRAVFIDWPLVTFAYTAQRTFKKNPPRTGFSYWSFVENIKGTPKRHKGHFIDEFDGRRHDCEGWLIDNPDLLKRLADSIDRREVVLELIGSQNPQLALKTKRPN